jgi:hypothetical protein
MPNVTNSQAAISAEPPALFAGTTAPSIAHTAAISMAGVDPISLICIELFIKSSLRFVSVAISDKYCPDDEKCECSACHENAPSNPVITKNLAASISSAVNAVTSADL